MSPQEVHCVQMNGYPSFFSKTFCLRVKFCHRCLTPRDNSEYIKPESTEGVKMTAMLPNRLCKS